MSCSFSARQPACGLLLRKRCRNVRNQPVKILQEHGILFQVISQPPSHAPMQPSQHDITRDSKQVCSTGVGSTNSLPADHPEVSSHDGQSIGSSRLLRREAQTNNGGHSSIRPPTLRFGICPTLSIGKLRPGSRNRRSGLGGDKPVDRPVVQDPSALRNPPTAR